MQSRTVRFPYEDGFICLEYDLEHAAPEAQQIAAVLDNSVFESLSVVCRWLVGCLVSWSRTTDGIAVPITVEVLQDLPVRLVAQLGKVVVDDLASPTSGTP
jgi:hypothetical protein